MRWTARDLVAAGGLFAATAAVVLWQNFHLAVLWDLSYLLDSSLRIALGQVPYRDFPFAHAPLTFLIQAAIIRLAGRVYLYHVVYAAVVGGLATLLCWRITLRILQQAVPATAWSLSLLLTAPLTVLGIYCIYPHPIYDCDCIFAILVSVYLLGRLAIDPTGASGASGAPVLCEQSPARGCLLVINRDGRSRLAFVRRSWLAFATGFSLAVPMFFKQNIGLPFFIAAVGGVLLLICAGLLHRLLHGLHHGRREQALAPAPLAVLATILIGASTALGLALVLLERTAGLGNYIHWTVQFAAQRRLPGLSDMLDVYREPSLVWTLPTVALGLVCLGLDRFRGSRIAALMLLAAPFVWTTFRLVLSNDAEDRAATLLALWPLLLILASLAALYKLCAAPSLNALIPILLLVAINGTLMSQQLWGSTYALWPLLTLLLAGMIAQLATDSRGQCTAFAPLLPALSGVIGLTLLVCGGLYVGSEERLSYVQISDGPLVHATLPALKGMSARGRFLPDFEQLIRFAEANIPAHDGVLLINGEDPFYFATGRTPQFPVLLFDKATDPYSPAQIIALVRERNIRWLIVKRNRQLGEDPMPQREATMQRLATQFSPYARLNNYDVYFVKGT